MANDTIADLLTSLSPKQVDQLKKLLDVKADEEASKPKDDPLKEPIPFYNPRYRWERFYVQGRTKVEKFVNGKYVARTTLERDVLRTKKGHVFEGDDRQADNPLIDDRGGKWFNSKAYEYYMKRRAQ